MTEKTYKALIAIPDPALSETIKEAVAYCNHLAILAREEEEALGACLNHPDIVVCIVDWELSKQHFPWILSKLHKIRPRMGRLALIDSNPEELKIKAPEKEFCCCLKKPVQIDELKKGLLQCVEKFEAEMEGKE